MRCKNCGHEIVKRTTNRVGFSEYRHRHGILACMATISSTDNHVCNCRHPEKEEKK